MNHYLFPSTKSLFPWGEARRESFIVLKTHAFFGPLKMHFPPEKAIIPKWFTFPKYFIFLALETQEWLWQISRGNRINSFFYLQIQLHFKGWNQAKTSVYIVVLFTLYVGLCILYLPLALIHLYVYCHYQIKRLSVFNVSLCFCHLLHFLKMDSSSICFAFKEWKETSLIDGDATPTSFLEQYNPIDCNIPTPFHITLHSLLQSRFPFLSNLVSDETFRKNRTITSSLSFQRIQSKFISQIANSPFKWKIGKVFGFYFQTIQSIIEIILIQKTNFTRIWAHWHNKYL